MLRICNICLIALAVAAAPMDGAFAAKKKAKKKLSRSDLTSEQREAIHKEGVKICNKRYGQGQVVRVEVDYVRQTFVCWTY